MQKKSDAYRTALYDQYVVRSTITGTIALTTGEIYTVTDADIVPGSLTINNKCVNGSSFEVGSVYQGELSVQLKKDIDRYTMRGAKIEFTEHRYISDTETEDVYLGAFYVSEPSRSKAILSIKALDRMDNFDQAIQNDMVGTVYDLLTMACDACNIELEQDEAYISALPNAAGPYSVYIDLVSTYRDLIAYIGMITGTFATIANDKLRMRSYSATADITIGEGKRNDTVIEDYKTYYKGVRARFIAEQNFAPYEYVDESRVDGLIMDLGDVPIVRGLPEWKYTILQNLLEMLRQRDYIPASFTLLTSDGALELGDRIKLTDTAETYITSLTYTYHSSEKIKGVGDNPRLKVTDSSTQRTNDMESEIAAKNIVIHSYTNAQALTLNAVEKEIISINYTAAEDAKPIFLATIPFTVDLDGYVTFRYYVDGASVEDDTVREYVERGEHFATLTNNLVITAEQRRTLSVRAYTEYFESDTREQAAKILSFENYISTGTYTEHAIDTTVPTATIPRGGIKAALFAQGLVSSVIWDGTLFLTDELTDIDCMVPVVGLSDTVTIGRLIPTRSLITDTIVELTTDIQMVGITGEAGKEFDIDVTVRNYILDVSKAPVCELTEYVEVTETEFRQKTVFLFESAPMQIDRGKACDVKIDTSGKDIQSVEVEVIG